MNSKPSSKKVAAGEGAAASEAKIPVFDHDALNSHLGLPVAEFVSTKGYHVAGNFGGVLMDKDFSIPGTYVAVRKRREKKKEAEEAKEGGNATKAAVPTPTAQDGANGGAADPVVVATPAAPVVRPGLMGAAAMRKSRGLKRNRGGEM